MINPSRLSSLFLFLFFISQFAVSSVKDAPEETFDGLKRVHKTKVDLAYVKVGTDFSLYEKFLILDCYVAFKKGWEKDYRDINRRHISSEDMDGIKAAVSDLFNEVFAEDLEKKGGYRVVSEAAEDVLLLRPALIDLKITAPDVPTTGRSYVYSSSAGEATLYLEIFDSLSGEILARVVDRRSVEHPGDFLQWSNRVTNRSAAKRTIRRWAGLLRDRFDEVKRSDSIPVKNHAK